MNRATLNPKFEILNSKQYQISKIQISEPYTNAAIEYVDMGCQSVIPGLTQNPVFFLDSCLRKKEGMSAYLLLS